LYGDLPSTPRIPPSFTGWKDVVKPVGLLLALAAVPVAVIHYLTQGPQVEQPEPGADADRRPAVPEPPRRGEEGR
jgi:hypothetical protein